MITRKIHIKIILALVVACFCARSYAQFQPGSSCQNPITLTNDYNASISGAGTVWYVANTFDLPLTVKFYPTNNSDPKPDIEMDFSCTPGVYSDTILCSFFCSSNSVYISMPYNPENDVRQKTDEQGHVYYEVAMGEYYRNLLLSAGISYNVQVFVKVTYHSSGTITLSPDAEFAGCMDTDDWLLFGNWLDVDANDQSTHFVAPYASWKKDSVRFIWDGPADATVAMGSSCSFEPLNPLDSRRIDVWTMNGGGDTTNHTNADIQHYLQYNASGDMYFIKVVSSQPGRFKAERMPLAKPDGNATLLEYDQPTIVNANDVDALYAFPMTWKAATLFSTPSPYVFKMYIGTTPTFTPATAIATYKFDKMPTGHQLGLFEAEMEELWTHTKKKYLYVRFETAAATTITPSLWTPSDCMNKVIRVEAKKAYSVKQRSASYYGLFYSEWVGGDMTLSWVGSSKCPVYIGDTCANMNSATNIHVFQDESVPRGGSYTIPGSEIAEWAEYVDPDGFIYMRFNPTYAGTMTITTNAPEEEDGCVSVIEQTTVTAWDSTEWRGTTYKQTGIYDIPNNNEECPDSIYRLDLTIHTTSYDAYEETGCDSIQYNGKKYTATGVFTDTLFDAGGNRTVMTLNFTINHPTSSETTLVECDSLLWNGEWRKESRDYTYKTTNAVGCDSTAILHLTIHHSYAITLPDTAVCETEENDGYVWGDTVIHDSGVYTRRFKSVHQCDSIVTQQVTMLQYTHGPKDGVNVTAYDSYTTEGGVTYTKSISGAIDYLVNAAGCDSIVGINLTIRHLQVNDTIPYTLCASELPFEWYGKQYTESGLYTSDTLLGEAVNKVYMDTLHTVNLTVLPLSAGDTTATACESFKWYGKTYTESAEPTHTLANIHGCDSIVTLHLTIHHANTGDTTATACESFEWYGKTYTESAEPKYTLTNIHGCDSVVTLHLTIHHATSSEETRTEYERYTWNGKTYTESGDYTFETTNAAGCDSTATLHLTIKEMPVFTYDTVYFCTGFNTEHEELISETQIRRYRMYTYESPAEWAYQDGLVVGAQDHRIQLDLRHVEQRLEAHYIGELEPIKTIQWIYRKDGETALENLTSTAEPIWKDYGYLTLDVRFTCGHIFSETIKAGSTEGVEEIDAAQPTVRKVIQDGQIYILRGKTRYSIVGGVIE